MAPDPVRRFSLSMPGSLVRQLDELVTTRGYANRSQAVADTIRARLVAEHGQDGNREIAGTITLVYDHHKRDLQAHLTDLQHDCETLIVAVMHVHLDHHHCMEVLAVRGRADAVRQAADRMLTAKGVKHCALTVTANGPEIGH